MAESPPIETARLRIVPFAEEHLTDRYVGWLNDPEVVRYSDQRHYVHTIESCRDYLGSFIGSPNYFWAILARDEDRPHIGNISAHVDPVHLVADVGILLGERRIWGRGYGAEAWMAVCKYLLGDAGMRKVSAGTLAVNAGMLGVMRRAGMVPDGRRHRHSLYEGREVDIIHMALFRDSYPADTRAIS
jgi:RimJ/RimL family protein N-acetyltransferase